MYSLPRLRAPADHRPISRKWISACFAVVVTLVIGGLAGLHLLPRTAPPLTVQNDASMAAPISKPITADAAADVRWVWPAPAVNADDGREQPPTF
jgi:hypothetical protein